MKSFSECKKCKNECPVRAFQSEQKRKQKKSDVCILCFSSSNKNYGANLVCYAMSEIVKKFGYSADILNFYTEEDDEKESRFLGEAFINFRNEYLSLTPKKKYNFQFKLLNYFYKIFISGSDQVFNTFNTKHYATKYFLDFVNDKRKKIAFSASFGMEQFVGDRKLKYIVKKLLNRFDAISVREKTAIDVLNDTFGSDYGAQLTIDPTLMLDENDYAAILKNKKCDIDEKYIAYYMLTPEYNMKIKETLDGLEKIRQFYQLPLINIHHYFVFLPCGEKKKYYEVADWLSYIKNSEFVVTDSFHGVCFSIIYKKKFLYIDRIGGTRVRYLLKILGLDNLIQNSFDDINVKEIDYDEVYEKLEKLRSYSYKYLHDSISNFVKQ